jgi:hypothetical protein
MGTWILESLKYSEQLNTGLVRYLNGLFQLEPVILIFKFSISLDHFMYKKTVSYIKLDHFMYKKTVSYIKKIFKNIFLLYKMV